MSKEILQPIWNEAQSWIYDRDDGPGKRLDFTETATADIMAWLKCFPQVEKYDINSALGLFEEWAKKPFSEALDPSV